MAVPAFSAAGTGTTGNPAWPTHASGDFGLLLVEHPDSSVSTPSGWTVAGSIAAPGGVCLTMFYRFATSAAESAPVISGSANHNWSTIITYTGVNTANPIHMLSVSDWPDGGAVGLAAPGMTTLLPDCLVVNVYAWSADNAGPLLSTSTNANLSSLTSRYDAGTTTGNGGGLIVLDGGMATEGSFTFTAIDISTNAAAGVATIVLQSAQQAFGQKSRIVNTRM